MTRLNSDVALPEYDIENRRWLRYPVDVCLRATVRTNNVNRTVHGRGTELESSGVAAVLPIDLVVGKTIEIDITLPYSTQSLTLEAIVRNRSSFTYGLEFRNISSAQQTEVERVCHLLLVLGQELLNPETLRDK
jgi:hypothetical protein